MLHEAPGYPLAKPKGLTPDEVAAEAQGYFEQWMPLVQHAIRLAESSVTDHVARDAAFMLHQAVERAYHCVFHQTWSRKPASCPPCVVDVAIRP